MEGAEGYVVLVVLLLGVPLVAVIWLIIRALLDKGNIDQLARRLNRLEAGVWRLEQSRTAADAPEPTPISTAAAQAAAAKPAAAPVPPAPPSAEAPPPANFPPLPAAPPAAPFPALNWEQFMGVKLIAWVGGLALFLGVVFFIKYAFDNNYLGPQVRMALSFLTGLGLVAGGVKMARRDYSALAQTLCGTGVVILYAAAFACHAVYRFPFFGWFPTFLLMVLITAAAFLLAVRLEAQVVAVLGMLGGFLTPILLSTGKDNPLGLFGYIAILDTGLLLVALHRRWFFLTPLAAAGTALMQVIWSATFFAAGRYFEGDKVLIPMAVLAGFVGLFLAAAGQAKRTRRLNWWFTGPLLGLVAVALLYANWFLAFPPLAARPWLMFGFVFMIDVAVTVLVLLDDRVALAQPGAGLAVFSLLAAWTGASLTNGTLNAALVFYFLLAALHAAFPVFLQRRRGVNAPAWTGQLFPPLALVLVLIPLFRLDEVSFLVWPIVLLVDLLAIALAVMTTSLLTVVAVLLLTLAAVAALIFKIPATLTGLPTSFSLVGAFAVFFVAAGLWLTRRFRPRTFGQGVALTGAIAEPGSVASQLPVLAGMLPFLLLILATLRLPLLHPSPVFGLALLLVVLLLGLTRLFALDWMPAVGLGCVAALECAWHFNRFNPAQAPETLAWYLLFLAVFMAFPFLFLRRLGDRVLPWAAAALAGPVQFFFVHRLVKAAYPNDFMGLLPAAFALPALLGLVTVLKRAPATSPARLTQLAWFGGVALFFVTLVFPVQFDREWITMGWGLEGAALLWLFHRVPHPGLRLAGLGLLLAGFVRLTLNPAVSRVSSA